MICLYRTGVAQGAMGSTATPRARVQQSNLRRGRRHCIAIFDGDLATRRSACAVDIYMYPYLVCVSL